MPFFLSSVARQILRKSLANGKWNGWTYSEWFDESDDHMMHIRPENGEGEIKMGFVYEIDGKVIKNIKTEKPGNVVEEAIYNDGKEYKVRRHTLDINESKDKIKYALDNARYAGDSKQYDQKTAESELLGEFDNSEDGVDALTRKRAFLSGQCIQQPLFAYVDDHDDYVVYDGNSRLANAREILRHSKKADGYAINTLIVLPKGISQLELSYIKADAQQPAILKHSKSQRAIEIYRMADGDEKKSRRDCREVRYTHGTCHEMHHQDGEKHH